MKKAERKFLRPAVVFGWKIEIVPWRKTPLWDGDSMAPVKVGKLAESLIERGYLERVNMGRGMETIRATHKAKALKCNAGSCSYGKFIDGDGQEVGDCPHCDGGIQVIEGERQ